MIPVSCNKDCGGGCPLAVEYRDGKPSKLINNPLRPDKDINLCARGARAIDEAVSTGRLLHPLKRTGARGEGRFTEISWDDALGEIAEGLGRIENEFGTDSLMSLAGSGSCRAVVHQPERLATRFFSGWGRVTTTKGWYSNTAADFASKSVYGTGRIGQDAETLDGAELVILWGANISELRFGAKLEPVLRRLKKAGVPFYVIDPRLTRTGRTFAGGSPLSAGENDSRWLAVKPGTDTALASAILFYMIEQDYIDRSFIQRYTSGFNELEKWITGESDGLPKTAGWASGITGLSEAQINTLSAAFAKAAPAAIIPGLSIQRALGGEESYRMIMALQVASGNAGRPGGTLGGCLWGSMPKPVIGTIKPIKTVYAPVRVPINNWTEAENIRCIYSTGSNYVQQSSNQNRTIERFRDCELAVCHDMFMTATAKWSDYVLPTTHFLERSDAVTVTENYLYYSAKTLDPPGEARDDYDIFRGLADRLGFGDEYSQGRSGEQWLDFCLEKSDVSDIAEFKRTGIFDGGEHRRIALSDFFSDPEASPLSTPSGRINFTCPENLKYGYPAHPHYRGMYDEEAGESEKYEPLSMLQLLTPHSLLRTNSQHSQLDWVKKKEFPLLSMNRADAETRGISDGMTVIIRNDYGSLKMPAALTDDVRPGVVWGLQGNWLQNDSLNVLSSTESTMPSSGSRTHTIWVAVEPAE